LLAPPFQFYKDSATGGILRGIGVSKFTNNCPSLLQLGDAASIAVLKIYPLDDLVKSENASVYLTILRISFSDRSRVLEKSDQDPRVTSLVLDYLAQKESMDPVLKKRIAYMKRCTSDFTCSSRGDFDSVKGQ
jgi:hypothetical protein